MNDRAGVNVVRSSSPQIIAGLLLLIAVLAWYSGAHLLTVISMIVIDGGVALLWIAAAGVIGAAVLRACRVEVHGLLLLTTGCAIGLGLFSLAMLVLGLAGWTSRASVTALAAIGALLGFMVPWPDLKRRRISADLSDRSIHWLWLIAMPFLAIILLGACLLPGFLWKPDDPHPYDALVYHLQVPREWYEAGRMLPLHHNMYSFFPFDTEMHYWAAMYLRGGPWEGMYTAQFMSAGFGVVAVLSLYAVATQRAERESNRFGAILACVLEASVPWVVMISSVTYVESLLLLYTSLAIGWTIYAIESAPQRIASFVVAGIFAGLAAGVKLTAAAMLLAAIPLSVIGIILARRSSRALAREYFIGCAAFVVTGALVLSPWMLRNAAWTGNPLFPVAMDTLGRGDYSAVQADRFRQAHSAPMDKRSASARLNAFGSQILVNWKYGYLLFPLALFAAIQQRKRISTWLCLAVLLIMAGVWMGFTHLIGRFFVPAIPVAALLVAQIEWKQLKWLGTLLVAIAAHTAWLAPHALNPRISGFAGDGGMTLAMTDLTQLLPDLLEPIERDSATQLHMVGDSQAFLHQLPMSRLHYRTVFDMDTTNVDPTNARQVLEAWVGAPLDTLPQNCVIYIDPRELLRLSQTYYKVPMLPQDLPGPRDRPFLISPRAIK